MKKSNTTHLDNHKAQPLGDTGEGQTGVPESEQGISNRAGDRDDDADEFEEDADDLDDSADGAVGPQEDD